jgi:4-amino-4-deoxy-L-arabinose transferase-like glycosyltransferase
MRMWDESMFAVNTYEMMQNGNYFSLFYNGHIDLYNTKPPLTNWFQLLSVKAFGYNELAIRIPSALAALLSVIFSFKFIAKHFDYVWAWAVALIILSSAGFVGFHTARTGESDAILTLFLVLTNIAFIRYIIENNKKQILYLFLFITLAFATKLYAALLFAPAYLFLLIYFKKFKAFVFSWQFLTGVFFFIGISLSFIILRDLESPRYIDAILSNDAGRLFTVLKQFEKSIFFYIENFYVKRYAVYFIFFLIGSAFLFLKNREENSQKILVIYFSLIISYLLIITLSSTKLPWYDMPLYPLLALVSAYPIVEIIRLLSKEIKGNKARVSYLLLLLIFAYPYYYRSSKSQGNKIDDGAIVIEANERYLHQAIRKDMDLDGLNVLYHGYNGPLLFYKHKLHEDGQEILLHKNIHALKIGDRVLVCKAEQRTELRQVFELEQLDNYQYADVYLLK